MNARCCDHQPVPDLWALVTERDVYSRLGYAEHHDA